MYFAYSGLQRGIELRIAQVLGVNSENDPAVFIAHGSDMNLKKYKWDGRIDELNQVSLGAFIDTYKKGQLKPYLKT